MSYPGKILCIEKQSGLENNLIVISDSANNRLVLVDESKMEFIE